jgi:hypothetical protein
LALAQATLLLTKFRQDIHGALSFNSAISGTQTPQQKLSQLPLFVLLRPATQKKKEEKKLILEFYDRFSDLKKTLKP